MVDCQTKTFDTEEGGSPADTLGSNGLDHIEGSGRIKLSQMASTANAGRVLESPEEDQDTFGEATLAHKHEAEFSVSESATVTSIETRSGQKAPTPHIVSRTLTAVPGKLSPSSTSKQRPEDSIEAIDALEDALEEIGNEIPVLGSSGHLRNDSSSDNSARRRAKRSVGPAMRTGASRSDTGALRSAGPKTVETRHVKTVSTPGRPTISRTSTLNKARTISIANADAKKASGELMESSKRRPTSLSFPTPAPPKARRPPTKPTFQLPGEAVAAKLKAKREERVKREEVNELKKHESKPRSIRTSVTPAIPVKGTAASRARISATHQQAGGAVSGGNKRASVMQTPRVPPKTAQITKSSTTITKSGPRRPSTKDGRARIPSTPSHTSRPRTTSGSVAPSHPRDGSSNAAAPPKSSSVTASDIVQQRQKAREIFARDRQENEEREAGRRLKEDAARKARAEAAERGRMASREWAERQKAKQTLGSAATNGVAAGSEMASETG